jgi:hypothetical protein
MEHRNPQLSQAYRDAAHPEPSPALDARILDAARQAVAKSAVRKRPAWFAWAAPFSTAAVLILGITLLFQMQRETPEVLESPTAIPPASLDPTTLVPAETAPTRPTGAAEPTRPTRASKQRARPLASETPSAPESAVQELGETADAAFPAQTLQPPTAAKAEDHLPMAAPVSPQDATEAMATPAARLSAPASKSPAREGANAMEKRMVAEPRVESPEQRLETIRRLLRAGRVDEARQALEELRQAYPQYDIPDDVNRP